MVREDWPAQVRLGRFNGAMLALPALSLMLKRHSSAGMHPRMDTITGAFQILWVYYGLLLASRPVEAWKVIAALINFSGVGAYRHFARIERAKQEG
jgi:MtN3 and saliva related transmembrane protein